MDDFQKRLTNVETALSLNFKTVLCLSERILKLEAPQPVTVTVSKSEVVKKSEIEGEGAVKSANQLKNEAKRLEKEAKYQEKLKKQADLGKK
jgi:hypothetical protein